MKLLALNSFTNERLTLAFLWLFLTPIMLVGFAIYLEVYQGLAPCPLCTIQRGEYLLISFGGLMGMIFNRYRLLSSLFLIVSFIGSILGILTAGRHVQLQYMDPSEVPACGPDLAYMMEAFPLFDTLKSVFTGSGSCADVDWTFLYLSIPEWALICFLFYMLLSGAMLSIKLKMKENRVLF